MRSLRILMNDTHSTMIINLFHDQIRTLIYYYVTILGIGRFVIHSHV